MSEWFVIREGDTASPLTDQLLDDDGNPVGLVGASVTLTLVPLQGGTPLVNNANAQVTVPLEGRVAYEWQAGDTDKPGFYLGSWLVAFQGGELQTFPNEGYFLVRVTEDQPLDLDRDYVSVEDLKLSIGMSGYSFADRDIERSISAASRAIDEMCRRRFWLDPYEADPADYVTRVYRPVSGGEVYIDDLTLLVGVRALDPDPDATPGVPGWVDWVSDTDYVLEPMNAALDGQPFTRLRSASYVDTARTDFAWSPFWPLSIEVQGRWGWPAVPDAIVQATLILAAQLLRRTREAPFGVLQGTDGEAVRIARTDPQVEALVRPYRRALKVSLA